MHSRYIAIANKRTCRDVYWARDILIGHAIGLRGRVRDYFRGSRIPFPTDGMTKKATSTAGNTPSIVN